MVSEDVISGAMKASGFLWANLLIVVLYSAALTIWNGPFGHLSEGHLVLIIAHVIVLFLWAILRGLQREKGVIRIVMIAFIVAVVGGAMCFWNFMSHMH